MIQHVLNHLLRWKQPGCQFRSGQVRSGQVRSLRSGQVRSMWSMRSMPASWRLFCEQDPLGNLPGKGLAKCVSLRVNTGWRRLGPGESASDSRLRAHLWPLLVQTHTDPRSGRALWPLRVLICSFGSAQCVPGRSCRGTGATQESVSGGEFTF